MQIFKENNRNILILVAILLVIGIGYRIYDNIQTNRQRANKISSGQTLAVQTEIVKKGSILPILKFSGSLEPIWQADISSKVASRIDKILVYEGDQVASGQILIKLDASEFVAQVEQARGTVYESQASLEQAQTDLLRAEQLLQNGAVSKQERDTANYKKNMAIGKLESVRGNLGALQIKLDNTVITAPRSGVIAKKYVQEGTFANISMPIINLADTTSLLAKINIGEAEIVNVHLGQEAVLKINAYGEREFIGKVTRISPVASLPARSFSAEITIDNSKNELKAGMFANAFITTKLRENVVVIPQSAIVMREDQQTVYVVNKDNVLEQKLIKAGYTGEGKIEVLAGINEGDTIVVAGQNKLHEGVKVRLDKKEDGKV